MRGREREEVRVLEREGGRDEGRGEKKGEDE